MSRHTIEDETLDISKVRPIGDYILIEVLTRTMTLTGLILPNDKGTEVCIGKVLAMGKGIWNEKRGGWLPFELEVGESVLCMEYAGERIELREGKYRMVHSRWVAAKVTVDDEVSLTLSALEPRMDYLLVEPHNEAMTRSGILHLPDHGNAESAIRGAKVVAVGPGIWHSPTCKRLPTSLKPGDDVIMTRYAGADVKINGKKLRLIQEDDVKCQAEGM